MLPELIAAVCMVLLGGIFMFLVKLHDAAKSIEATLVWLVNDRDRLVNGISSPQQAPLLDKEDGGVGNDPGLRSTHPVSADSEQEILAEMNEVELATWEIEKMGRETLYPGKPSRLTPYLFQQIRRRCIQDSLRTG